MNISVVFCVSTSGIVLLHKNFLVVVDIDAWTQIVRVDLAAHEVIVIVVGG